MSAGGYRRFDKEGEQFYDQISALHKSVRGTRSRTPRSTGCAACSTAAAIRATSRAACCAWRPRTSATPIRARCTLALEACEVYERLGSPEGELALAQAVVFMACAPKSNAVYAAFDAAMADAQQHGTLDVPLRLRNAPTRLMKGLGLRHGLSLRARRARCVRRRARRIFPMACRRDATMSPVPRGLEIKIAEALARLRQAHDSAQSQITAG